MLARRTIAALARRRTVAGSSVTTAATAVSSGGVRALHAAAARRSASTGAAAQSHLQHRAVSTTAARAISCANAAWPAVAAAAATTTAVARDRILLKGLTFHGFHGAFAAEKQLGQRFVVDAELWCDLRGAGESDDLRVTVDYAAVFNAIRAIVEGPNSDALIERVADRIARAVLSGTFSTTPTVAPSPTASSASSGGKAGKPVRIEQVRVRVKKPHVAVAGVVEYLGVDIVRTRHDYALP